MMASVELKPHMERERLLGAIIYRPRPATSAPTGQLLMADTGVPAQLSSYASRREP